MSFPSIFRIKSIALVFASLSLGACNEPLTEHHDTLLLFGTFVEVTILDEDQATASKAMAKIKEDLEYLHYALHPWKSGPMGRTNQLLAAAGKFTANPSVIPALKKAKALEQQSQGYFNPAIGKLIGLWGFHSEFAPEGPPPPEDEIEQLVNQQPSMQSIRIKGVSIDNSNSAVRLDFGGFAKGYALDQAMQSLKQLGIEHAIVNAGGDLNVMGRHGDRPWHIGIRHPRERDKVIASVDVSDGEAVYTSGDYERYYEYQGRRYHHIIDPRSGYPVQHTRSVTVIGDNGAHADAAATALFIAGPDEWQKLARAMSLEYVMLIDAQGRIHMSKAMQQRVQFEMPVEHVNSVSLQ